MEKKTKRNRDWYWDSCVTLAGFIDCANYLITSWTFVQIRFLLHLCSKKYWVCLLKKPFLSFIQWHTWSLWHIPMHSFSIFWQIQKLLQIIERHIVEILKHVTAQIFALLKAIYYCIVSYHAKYSTAPQLKHSYWYPLPGAKHCENPYCKQHQSVHQVSRLDEFFLQHKKVMKRHFLTPDVVSGVLNKVI